MRDIKLGIPTLVGAYTYMSGPANLRGLGKIGRFCSLGNSVNIGPGQHPTDWLSTSPFQYTVASFDHPEIRQFGLTGLRYEAPGPVEIGNDVWIGSDVIIQAGVKVGNGAIIGSGAVVTKDVPDYAIVVGIPAKVLRYRFSEDNIERLLKLRWWDYDLRSMKSVPFDQIDVALDQLEAKKEAGTLEPRHSKLVQVLKEYITPDPY